MEADGFAHGAKEGIWEAASPKQISSGSKKEKFDHPTQKPIALMERPIENHDAGSLESRETRRNTSPEPVISV